MFVTNKKLMVVCFLFMGMAVVNNSAAGLDDVTCDKALEVARNTYNSGDSYDKFLAAEALFQSGEPVDLSFLFDAIDPQMPFLARSAILTIISMNDLELTKQLIRLSEGNREIADLLIQSLQHQTADGVYEFIRRYLEDDSSFIKQVWAMKAVARSENALLGEQIERNYQLYSEKLIQTYVLYALARLKIDFPYHEKETLDFANDSDHLVREMSAVVMGELNTEGVVAQLKKLISDESPRVRIAALGSFIKVSGGERKEDLLAILLNKTKESKIAAGSLKRLEPEVAIELAEIYMQSSEKIIPVTLRIMESIGALKGGSAKDLFRRGLDQNNEDLTIQILFAIAQRSQVDEDLLLVPLLEHESSAIRSTASWAVLGHSCTSKN